MSKKKLNNMQKDYFAGMKYKELQKKYEISKGQLVYIIQKNGWKRSNSRSMGQLGNKNAQGNIGGPGAEEGNKRALATGEYENLFSGCFSDAEQNFFFSDVEIDKKKEMISEYKILRLREARMLNRIEKLKNSKNMTMIHRARYIHKSDTYNIENDTTTFESNAILIHRIEEGLTRVQDSMRKCIESMHKMNIDDKRLEIELADLEGDEIEDTSETDADIYGS